MHARPRILKNLFGRKKKSETEGEFERGRNWRTTPDTSEDSVQAPPQEISIQVIAAVMTPPPSTHSTGGESAPGSTDEEEIMELQNATLVDTESNLVENGANHDMSSSNHQSLGADGDGSVGSDRNSRSDSSAVRRGSFVSDSEAPEREMYEDAPSVVKAYDAIPVLEQTKLPRGGISMETKAVGRVQFGIPPETIKDSMRLGIPVPQVYIVPVERFCREMGPALGVNLAEFEFPAYFNFFVYKKRCTLVVDSEDAEDNIRRVFSETLLGPAQFRREENPIQFEEEDFDPDFPRDAIPNFQKELMHFRIMPDGKELVLETLLDFCHFETPGENGVHDNLGVPRSLRESELEDAESPGESSTHDDDDEKLQADEEDEGKAVPVDLKGVEKLEKIAPWTYSQARFVGDVATIWPPNATDEQKKAHSVPRVEIFKMPGGTEYILHDIDENNYIVGKARFSGHVKVSESMSVDGFGGRSMLDDFEFEASDELDDSQNSEQLIQRLVKAPPTFHPPSFGVTVLGNSHGFDKSGSVSGYVLWINGRGVMIDPPPYSSATLEREGIRPRTIVGIILTHCHADHDAGAFQKVLTGSPVVVITTPTIYKSFIRKYAALSALSPALLRHSHRHKPAIIGRPLRFQGATFHFTYTLHTIPCVGFRVDWRGRSMVFTGDHFNSPPAIDMLQGSGVLSKARADDLRNLPLQETDLLLHEAGAPPIHTPLDVLKQLPPRVKKRLYVVHTSALPEDCELRVAPTGTAGTIRLDQLQKQTTQIERSLHSRPRSSLEDDQLFSSPWSSASNEYEAPINEDSISITDIGVSDPRINNDPRMMQTSFAHLALATPPSSAGRRMRANSLMVGTDSAMPLVSLRPASSTDAWFILNLLSAVPFLTSLSYASTMEVLETARVDAYCMNDVIVSAARRSQVLCVVWEGTCVEREKKGARRSSRIYTGSLLPINEADFMGRVGAVWHAGDWTGPIALQPERRLSGESDLSETHDIVAMSSEGVKVITVEFSDLHSILKSGSPLYRKYIGRTAEHQRVSNESLDMGSSETEKLLTDAMKNLNVLELLDCNSALRKLSAVQKRHLECLAEGPISFAPGERLWRSGAPVDRAFLIVSGTASFVPKRRNAGSVGLPPGSMGNTKQRFELSPPGAKTAKLSLGESMRLDAIKAMRELGVGKRGEIYEEDSTIASEEPAKNASDLLQLDSLFSRSGSTAVDGAASSSSVTDAHDYAKLSRGLQKRAELITKSGGHVTIDVDTQEMSDVEDDEFSYGDFDSKDKRALMARRRSSRARFANKVLGRLYNRRAFTGGLVFSRGHFLGDVSKMVHGVLSSDTDPGLHDDASIKYGFGDSEHERIASMYGGGENLSEIVIHEQDDGVQIVHTSTLTSGKDGCVALVFPKASLIPFLDEYPGLLLSLLGTQVVV